MINDERCKPKDKICHNDQIDVSIPDAEASSWNAEDINLDIIFACDDYAIINKPAGISMHPGAGDYDKTLVNALINYDKKNLSNIGITDDEIGMISPLFGKEALLARRFVTLNLSSNNFCINFSSFDLSVILGFIFLMLKALYPLCGIGLFLFKKIILLDFL